MENSVEKNRSSVENSKKTFNRKNRNFFIKIAPKGITPKKFSSFSTTDFKSLFNKFRKIKNPIILDFYRAYRLFNSSHTP